MKATSSRRWGCGSSRASRSPVKEGACFDTAVEHFFETGGLGAELDAIAVFRLGAAVFVLHGVGTPCSFLSRQKHAGVVLMELDDVGHAGDLQALAAQGQAAGDVQAGAVLALVGMGFFVKQAALRREDVFLPLPLDVDQRPLARTEQ